MFDGHGAESVLVERDAAKRLEAGAFDIEAEEMNERRRAGAAKHLAERRGRELDGGTLLGLGLPFTQAVGNAAKTLGRVELDGPTRGARDDDLFHPAGAAFHV